MKQIQNNLKIGIPDALFAAYNLSYWQNFFELSGIEAVISDNSTKEMADLGGRLIPHEFCIPIKVFMGHILNLLDKKVDQILLPRMRDYKKTNFFCPKLIGLPEIVKFTLNLEDKMLFSPEVICNGLNPQVTKFPTTAATSLRQMQVAEKQAQASWKKTLENCRNQKIILPEATGRVKIKGLNNQLTVGLLGYAYCLYDPFISKGILSKLNKLGVAINTWEMLEPKLLEQTLAGLKRPLYWNFGRMLLGAGLSFLKDPTLDGIIYVTTFGCGPDSVATEILSIEALNHQKPFLLINLDEHTEDGHLFTRLEAFIDMLTTLKEDQAV